jgi:hypothetical protein
MTLLLLIALQSSPAPAPAPADARPVEFDLRTYKPSSDCGDPAAAGGILVCGRRPGGTAYPLERMAKIFEQGPADAETGLFGTVRGRAYVEEVAMPGGQVSKRVMIGIKLPF